MRAFLRCLIRLALGACALTAVALSPGAFRPISYEWGVTYSGMLLAAEATGDPRYTEYVAKRLRLTVDAARQYRDRLRTNPGQRSPLRAHVRDLAARQSGSGFWHQLLDREDSYLETSATAIYAYAMARAIDRGWIDPLAYGPPVLLAWNAVTSEVDARGQVEGTCVGTGMGFEPAFYYHRPTSVYAAHGYGPVLLAGAQIIRLLTSHRLEINDSGFQLYRR